MINVYKIVRYRQIEKCMPYSEFFQSEQIFPTVFVQIFEKVIWEHCSGHAHLEECVCSACSWRRSAKLCSRAAVECWFWYARIAKCLPKQFQHFWLRITEFPIKFNRIPLFFQNIWQFFVQLTFSNLNAKHDKITDTQRISFVFVMNDGECTTLSPHTELGGIECCQLCVREVTESFLIILRIIIGDKS